MYLKTFIAANALFRPGPMNQIPQFVASKHDFSKSNISFKTYTHIRYDLWLYSISRTGNEDCKEI